MTPEQQRIAIAEACGYINVRMWSESCIASMGMNAEGKYWGSLGVPDYLNDLNAMHEAEQMLWRMDWRLRDDFIDHLARIINPIHGYRMQDGIDLLDATAAQRAEAFLKTISKWEDNL